MSAAGPQAEQALAAIRRLADEGFGDPPEPARRARADPPARLLRRRPARAWRHRRLSPLHRTLPRGSGGPRAGVRARRAAGVPGLAIGAARTLRPAPVELPATPVEDPAAEWAALERAIAATAQEMRLTRASVAARTGAYEAGIFDAHELFLQDEALLGPARDAVFARGLNAAHAWSEAVAAAAAAWDSLDDPYQRGAGR